MAQEAICPESKGPGQIGVLSYTPFISFLTSSLCPTHPGCLHGSQLFSGFNKLGEKPFSLLRLLPVLTSSLNTLGDGTRRMAPRSCLGCCRVHQISWLCHPGRLSFQMAAVCEFELDAFLKLGVFVYQHLPEPCKPRPYF